MKTLITGASGFIGKSLIKQSPPGQIHVVSRKKSMNSSNGIFEHLGDLQKGKKVVNNIFEKQIADHNKRVYEIFKVQLHKELKA